MVLGLLALLSIWVLSWLVVRSVVDGMAWTGVDGLHPSDQLQYVAWIRNAGRHVLISNLFTIGPSQASFFHPGFFLSGLVADAGVAPWLAYLLWKPLAVIALFLGVRAYVHRLVPSRAARLAALALALFFVSTAAFLSSVLGASAYDNVYLFGFEVELWPGTWLWGYSFTVLAVAAMPICLLLYERARDHGRLRFGPPLTALLCSWFQPWQGATLLGILLFAELLAPDSELSGGSRTTRRSPRVTVRALARRRRSMQLLVFTLAAGAAPLLYYALLAKSDPAWNLAGQANQLGAWPIWALLATIAPLGAPAVLAYLEPSAGFQSTAVRTWPLAGLAIYWGIAYGHVGTFAIHAFQGLTIPLAILAVVGIRQRMTNAPRAANVTAGVLVAAAVLPALVWKLNDAQRSTAHDTVAFFATAPPNPFFVTHDEQRAMRYLSRSSLSGGVLASAYLGETVPAETGRQTWVGLPSWTPHYAARVAASERLFSGRMNPEAAQALVRSTRARYVLTDCQHRADPVPWLRPLTLTSRRFGCALLLTLGVT